MSTQLSTESGDAKKGFSTHQNQYNVQARHRASSARSVANLSPAQLNRKRKNDRDSQRELRQRTKEYIQQLQRRVKELEYLLAAKNAADNNNNNNNSVGTGMSMDLDQNMGADTANTKRQIYTDNNMVGAFGKGTSTGDIYNVGEEGGYGDIAFSNHITQQPWESLASGNLLSWDEKCSAVKVHNCCRNQELFKKRKTKRSICVYKRKTLHEGDSSLRSEDNPKSVAVRSVT